jgi:hypothetical protein
VVLQHPTITCANRNGTTGIAMVGGHHGQVQDGIVSGCDLGGTVVDLRTMKWQSVRFERNNVGLRTVGVRAHQNFRARYTDNGVDHHRLGNVHLDDNGGVHVCAVPGTCVGILHDIRATPSPLSRCGDTPTLRRVNCLMETNNHRFAGYGTLADGKAFQIRRLDGTLSPFPQDDPGCSNQWAESYLDGVPTPFFTSDGCQKR